MSNAQKTVNVDPNEDVYVNLEQAKDMVIDVFKAGLVPYVQGSPGVGKSAMAAAIAEAFNLLLIDIRLSTYDPTDLNGFPSPNLETRRSGYLPPEDFPLEGDPIPAGYNGWLILLDELPSAALSVQAAAYKVIFDKKIGQHPIHKKAVMMAAGNLVTDNAIVNEIGTAMQSRLIHILVKSNLHSWVKVAEDHDFDQRVISFVNFLGVCNDFNPEHSDNTFMCERTLEFLHKLIHKKAEITQNDYPLLAGTIGKGQARQFIGFCQVYAELPTFQEILANPDTARIPKEKAAMFALTGMLSKQGNEENIPTLMPYILRLDIEFQVITLRSLIRKYPGIMSSPEILQWSMSNIEVLHGS